MLKLMCSAVMLVAIGASQAWAQNPRGLPTIADMGNIGGPGTPASTNQVDPARARMDMEIVQRENQDRQLALKRDTDKLLALATELKQNVDRTGPNILSVDVVKKAQEIEKLAKSVKDKMKGD